LLQEYPSATANVLRAMLLKIGRPHAEVEKAVQEASQREADRMYANVRWLNLIAAVTPLFGLLGTVWGMIQTFHRTTHLSPLENKANFLASGIYVALVTTLGGLAVAIPAAILAHHFEGKIQSLFHHIDELLFQLLPQIERFEGRMRVDHETLSGQGSGNSVATSAGAVAAQSTAPPLPPASTPTPRS
jgi:biopolymer transport protein ExbB